MNAEMELNMQVMHFIDIIVEKAIDNMESIQECMTNILQDNSNMSLKEFIEIVQYHNNNLIEITNQISNHICNVNTKYYDLSYLLNGMYSDMQSIGN